MSAGGVLKGAIGGAVGVGVYGATKEFSINAGTSEAFAGIAGAIAGSVAIALVASRFPGGPSQLGIIVGAIAAVKLAPYLPLPQFGSGTTRNIVNGAIGAGLIGVLA